MKPVSLAAAAVLLIAAPAFASPASDAVTGGHVTVSTNSKVEVTSFKPDPKPIFFVGQLKSPAKTKVSAKWMMLKGTASKTIFAQDWMSTKPNQAFFFRLDAKGKAKPAGDYAVEVDVNGRPAKTYNFSVK